MLPGLPQLASRRRQAGTGLAHASDITVDQVGARSPKGEAAFMRFRLRTARFCGPAWCCWWLLWRYIGLFSIAISSTTTTTSMSAENHHVQCRSDLAELALGFQYRIRSNWHPLTWLSHIADYQVFGLRPCGHHLTNLIFHVANTLLLFGILQRMTGALWRSLMVAALFALHPAHVESVAWVAERKDVLSTFFFLLTLGAYARYAERQKAEGRIQQHARHATRNTRQPAVPSSTFEVVRPSPPASLTPGRL